MVYLIGVGVLSISLIFIYALMKTSSLISRMEENHDKQKHQP